MPENFIWLASPWWVNLFFFLPFAVFYLWKDGLNLSSKTLLLSGCFALAFGFVEAAVVVYLRYSAGLLTQMNLDAGAFSAVELLRQIPNKIWLIETMREAATIIILISVTLLATPSQKERGAIFLWIFSLWDISYYASLSLAIHWPASLLSPDILFLIPVPWQSQVWFPLLVSVLTATAVIARKKNI